MVNNTTDLAEFGIREIKMARDLLDAWLRTGLPDDFEPDEVTVMLNPHSGWVFLTNAEFQTAVLDNNRLVSFYCSPYEGHEGTMEGLNKMFNIRTWNGEDIDWFRQLQEQRLA